MPDSLGDNTQVRIIAEQLFTIWKEDQLRQPSEAPVPPLVKWLVGAIAAFGSAALIGLGFWLVTSVSEMRETLARMDERMRGQDETQISKDAEQDRQIQELQGYHREGAR